MYSLNGVPLDNPTYGWTMLADSDPMAGYVARLNNLEQDGIDGDFELPSSLESPMPSIRVESPKAHFERLRLLVQQKTLYLSRTSDPSRRRKVQFVTDKSPEIFGDDEAIGHFGIMLRANDVYYRDTAEITTAPASIGAAGSGSLTVGVDLFTGMSAPVTDAVYRIKGGWTQLLITDTEGQSFYYGGTLPNGSYMRFESKTGLVFVTTSDTWEAGTNVTADSRNGPGPGYFGLSPVYGDTFKGRVTVRTLARVGTPTLEVRGRRAFIA